MHNGWLSDKIYQSLDGQVWSVATSHNGGYTESISSYNGATYLVGGSNFILKYDPVLEVFIDSNTNLDGNNALMDVTINGIVSELESLNLCMHQNNQEPKETTIPANLQMV